jgi:hypothetical protein
MNKNNIIKCYALAKLALSDANTCQPFAASKAQAMRDINFWREQLRKVQL